MSIINLTQHNATADQIAAGVYDTTGLVRQALVGLLTFHDLPDRVDLYERALAIAALVPEGTKAAMIGGAPYLMGELERALYKKGVTPLYSFTTRESVEETLPDGSVKKINLFRHKGFVKP